MTIAQILRTAQQALTPLAAENAALEARLLAQHAWGMTHEELLRNSDVLVTQVQHDQLQPLLARRLNHEPMSQILGYKDFWRDRFIVTADVLTPRADSETLIEAVLSHVPDKTAPHRILDLGTGSGCLLLSLLRDYENATGIGVDASEKALEIAKTNAKNLDFGTKVPPQSLLPQGGRRLDEGASTLCSNLTAPSPNLSPKGGEGYGGSPSLEPYNTLHLTSRCNFLLGNWCKPLDTGEKFDIIISNPPYIARGAITALMPEVQGFEPHRALDGGADGLDCYREIFAEIGGHIHTHTLIVVEIGESQQQDVTAIAFACGFAACDAQRDLGGHVRALIFHPTKRGDNDA